MTKNNQNPTFHKPTVDLIMCAYPEGIPDAHYLTLLSILGQGASIRVLAEAIAHIRNGNYSIYMNDVVSALRFEPKPEVASTVQEKLNACGFQSWLEE